MRCCSMLLNRERIWMLFTVLFVFVCINESMSQTLKDGERSNKESAVYKQAHEYEKVLKNDSTSWTTGHLELEFIAEGFAYINVRDSLLYYDAYGSGYYYCVGRMREEDGKLWITYTEHPTEEILLMDMGLEVGDAFLVAPYHVSHVVEISHENGRKVIVFDFVSPSWGVEPLKFIEGVGRNYMDFEWGGDIDRSYQSCKFDDGELVYSTANPLYQDCRLINTSVEELFFENVDVEPAQVTVRTMCDGFVCINFSEALMGVKQIMVFDLMGRAMFFTETINNMLDIDFSEMPSGVYFINVIGNNGRQFTQKVVKQ